VKNTDSTFPWNFKRSGEILVELIDSLDFSKARDIRRFDIGADRIEDDLNPKVWYQGFVSFNVSPGLYRIIIEANDLESTRSFLDRKSTIRAKKFDLHAFETSTPLFVYWTNNSFPPKGINPENFGGNLEFGAGSALFFELFSNVSLEKPITIDYSFSAREGPDEESTVVFADTIHRPMTFSDFDLEPAGTDGSIRYDVATSGNAGLVGIVVPFASKKLPLRRFTLTLTVKQDTSKTKINKSFQTVWPEMPTSLKDVDRALQALHYITTEEVLDSLTEGSFETRRNNLEAFLATRDTTPETAYNEIMTEYYRRVDYASRSFGTINESDGAETDRGRIYILHGPPTKRERKLDPSSGFQEVWVYEDLNKKFIFIDTRKSGDYVLSYTQDL
jgi:GWxTD domain-containing protein